MVKVVANGWLVAEVPRMDHGGDEGEIRFFTKEGVVHMFMGEYSHTIDAKGRMIIPPSSGKSWEKNLY